MTQWYQLGGEAALKELDSSARRGLSAVEAEKRLERWGENVLRSRGEAPLWKRLLMQLKDPMILVLLAAAGLSLAASGGEDWLDATIILVIVVVNAVISLSQEDSARRALEALQNMAAPMARVLREGEELRVPCAAVVPGDILLLEAGDLVAADARLLECHGLKADESAMTGESVPAEKTEQAITGELPLAERHNMVFSSTVITAGRGRAVVTATGMDTEVGHIANLLLEQQEGETPLQRRMTEISKTLSFLCLCICGVMFGVGVLLHKPVLEMFLTAVSLAVAAIPEGLPAIVTIVLALGVQRLAKHNAIVKRLPAVETLGCAGVICSDKTGTLTENKMVVTEVWSPRAEDRPMALAAAALCNDAAPRPGGYAGDPTEVALAELCAREGASPESLRRDWPRWGELPFDSGRKLMTTIHRRPEGGFRLMVKGAPDVLIARCGGGEELRRAALRQNEAMARKALRVIALAWRDVAFLPRELNSASLEQELRFAGLMGMIDPPRREVGPAVERCRAAGIRPVMITGDHKLTAMAVARELGIYGEGDMALTGAELDFLPQEVLEEEVEHCSVFARVTPEHKMRIVRAWQSRGKVVAMTGDGVNDAPALKAADIGCAMGKSGTDVAKSAADMILTDDNFTTIVAAVEQGRGIYDNIKKAVHYLLSCNIGEIMTVFLATLLRFPQMPLTPVQLLWLNLVTDSLPALALGVENVEREVMDRPPRAGDERLFQRGFALRLCWQGCMVGALTLAAYFLGGWVLPGGGPAVANTMAFAALTLCQLFHAFDVRSEEASLFRMGVFSNRAMDRAFLVGLAMQLAVLCLPPLQAVFSTVSLTAEQWGAVLLLAVAPIPVCEAEKALRRRARRPERAKAESRR